MKLLYKPVGILILNFLVYKYLDARNRLLTITKKLAIGMCFGLITMCIAGTVEVFRQQKCDRDYGIRERNT